MTARLGSFFNDVRSTVLTGLSTSTNTAIAAADSVLAALGKLQAQINGALTSSTFTATGGTTALSLPARFGQRLTVMDFGAVADNTTDCTAAFQACVNYLMANGGGDVFIPAGKYKLASVVTITFGADTYTAPRVRIRGAGALATFITCTGNGFSFVGASGSYTHQGMIDIDGINMLGATTAGTVAIKMNNVSYIKTTDLIIENFDLAMDMYDTEIGEFSVDTRIRWNNKGMRAQTVSVTGFNSISLHSMSVANNYVWGCWFISGVNLKLDNADIQYNGASSQANTSWGLRLSEYGLTNGSALVADNAYFEGNGGCADLWFENTTGAVPAISTLTGCLFAKTDATRFVKNPILVTGTQPTKVFLIGCSFASVSPYVAAAANQYWSVTNTGAGSIVRDISNTCLFQAAVETPPFGGIVAYRLGTNANFSIGPSYSITGSVTLATSNDVNGVLTPMELRASSFTFENGNVSTPSLTVGTGLAPIGGTNVTVHAMTNANLVVQPAFSVAGSVAIGAINDLGTGNVPMEFRASSYYLGYGSVAIASTLSVGTGLPAVPGTMFTLHAATNANLIMLGSYSVAGAVTIGALNDAGNTPTPLEFRASSYTFNGVAVAMPSLLAGGATQVTGTVGHFRTATNVNLQVTTPYQITGAIRLATANDANNNQTPLEITASDTQITTGTFRSRGASAFDSTVSMGSATLVAGATASVHVAANQNLAVMPPSTVTGAVQLAGMNDAGSALVPIEYRASTHAFTAGTAQFMQPVYLTAGAAPGTPGAGQIVLYYDSADAKLKAKASTGVVTILASA